MGATATKPRATGPESASTPEKLRYAKSMSTAIAPAAKIA